MSHRNDRFDWSGGHPALDYVNTLDERPSASPIERLATYRDLVRFVELAGLVEPAIAARLMRLNGRPCTRTFWFNSHRSLDRRCIHRRQYGRIFTLRRSNLLQ